VVSRGEWAFTLGRARRAFEPAVFVWVPRDADAIVFFVAHRLTLLEGRTFGVCEIPTHAVSIFSDEVVRVWLGVFFYRTTSSND